MLSCRTNKVTLFYNMFDNSGFKITWASLIVIHGVPQGSVFGPLHLFYSSRMIQSFFVQSWFDFLYFVFLSFSPGLEHV